MYLLLEPRYELLGRRRFRGVRPLHIVKYSYALTPGFAFGSPTTSTGVTGDSSLEGRPRCGSVSLETPALRSFRRFLILSVLTHTLGRVSPPPAYN